MGGERMLSPSIWELGTVLAVLEITNSKKQICLRNSQTIISVKTIPYILTKQYSIILFTTTVH